jgi:hypothetical protein
LWSMKDIALEAPMTPTTLLSRSEWASKTTSETVEIKVGEACVLRAVSSFMTAQKLEIQTDRLANAFPSCNRRAEEASKSYKKPIASN